MPKIFIKFNTAIIKEVKLDKEVVTFGRKSANDIVINHPAVSGFHGKFVKEGNAYSVEDLNSTNGTYVNGRRVSKSKLEAKDMVRVAKHIMEYVTDDNAKATPPKPEDEGPTEEKKEESKPAPNPNLDKQKELLRKSLGLDENGKPVSTPKTTEKAPVAETKTGDPSINIGGVIKVVSGAVDGQKEVRLTGLVTYIGASDQASIKIKGFMAPSLAAAISKRQEGFFLKAVKPGYPKVNGNAINEQVLLDSGSLIECGGTNMVFYRSDDKKEAEK